MAKRAAASSSAYRTGGWHAKDQRIYFHKAAWILSDGCSPPRMDLKLERLPATDNAVESVMIAWRRGLDTYDIAQSWFVMEADVCRALTIGRERERNRVPEAIA
jgi:hypothetical protein